MPLWPGRWKMPFPNPKCTHAQTARMEEEQAAYEHLHESLLASHEGQYVATHDGEVEDADADELTLAKLPGSRNRVSREKLGF